MNYSIINCKGGTGKTTTAVNLASALADNNQKTLLIDLDPQANASLSLGIPFNELQPSIYHGLTGKTNLLDIIRKTIIPGLDIITGETNLASIDLILANQDGREFVLKQLLSPMVSFYDYMIFDCPPAMSMISINALVCSDQFIVPVTPEYLSMEGLITLLDITEQLKNNMDLDLELEGILFSKVRDRKSCQNLKDYRRQFKILDLIKNEYQEKIFNTSIKYHSTISEASILRKSIRESAPKSKSAKCFNNLAKEIIEKH